MPSPGPALEPTLVAEARGAADSLALRLRYHDAALHARAAPADAEARAVFDALEDGAGRGARRARDGAAFAKTLRTLTEARVRGDAIVRARTAEEVPLATAVGLIARERPDRRGAARGRAAPGSSWSRHGSRKRPRPSSTRWR